MEIGGNNGQSSTQGRPNPQQNTTSRNLADAGGKATLEPRSNREPEARQFESVGAHHKIVIYIVSMLLLDLAYPFPKGGFKMAKRNGDNTTPKPPNKPKPKKRS